MFFEFALDQSDDRRLLVSFLDQFQKGLRELVLRRVWIGTGDRVAIAFDGGPYLEQAWEEAEPYFDETRRAVVDASDQTLRDAGLSGGSLRTKLFLIMQWAQAVPALFDEAILRTLQNINNLLGSIVQATGAGEILRELKDIMLNNIESINRG